MNMIRWQRPLLATWPGLGRLTELRDEIDRVFEGPVAEFVRGSNYFSGWTPALDVFEDKDAFTVKVELPGMKKEDINVTLHDGSLSISGERKHEVRPDDTEVHRTERYVGRFQRTLTLPAAVAADRIKATYKDGVLSVHLPKTEEAKPKQIDVRIN
jgi:HSP20 family protein